MLNSVPIILVFIFAIPFAWFRCRIIDCMKLDLDDKIFEEKNESIFAVLFDDYLIIDIMLFLFFSVVFTNYNIPIYLAWIYFDLFIAIFYYQIKFFKKNNFKKLFKITSISFFVSIIFVINMFFLTRENPVIFPLLTTFIFFIEFIASFVLLKKSKMDYIDNL